MKNALDIRLQNTDFSLKDYVDEIGFIPLKSDVDTFEEKVRSYFIQYQENLRCLLDVKNTLAEFNRIIEIDIVLHYLYYTYTKSSEEFVDINFHVDESDILNNWGSMYFQELEYPKLLSLSY